MLRSYLQSAFRILIKERLYTIINIVGLSIGLTSSFLIYSWVKRETGFDRFPGSDRTYRITTYASDQGIASTYPMVRTRVLSQFPEIEASVRIFDRGFLGSKTRVVYGEKIFVDNRFYYADSTFLNVFPFRILMGNASDCLEKPNALVITETTARKIFGKEDPIGKTLIVGTDFEYEVTAVMQDIPAGSHFHFDMVASMLSHPFIKRAEENVWSGVVFHTYAKLRKGSVPGELQAKIASFIDQFPNDPDQTGKSYDFRLQPVRDIHLKSNLRFELEENGNIYYIYLFITIASMVMVIAIINYTNLSTARHTQRLKEVGVRKILGAERSQLIGQFITESLLVTLSAFILAVLLMESVRPLLSAIGGSGFNESLWSTSVLLASIGVSVFLGIVTGIIPAIILSSFKPVRLFKANLGTFAKGATLRKVLVISQFTVSIALTICTLVIHEQLSYINRTSLGYDKDHTVVLNIGYSEVRKKYQILKGSLAGHSSIIGSAAVSQLPSDIQTAENIDISTNQSQGVYCVSVDPDFFKVMNVEIKSGRELVQAIRPNDSLNYFVFNETALNTLGWTESEAIQKKISIRHGNQKPGQVKGVIRDFHFQSFHHNIEPLVLEFNPVDFQYLLVKIKPERTAETIQFIADKWRQVAGAIPFDFTFLDQEYDKLYRSETRSSTLFMVFSVVALFISSLGLFGLSSFAAEKRTREIGLRKVFGAGINSIMMLVSKDFIALLFISFFLSLPIGYYFMQNWLNAFVFKADFNVSIFILAGVVNILFALIVLSYHIIRISRTKPVDTLKYE